LLMRRASPELESKRGEVMLRNIWRMLLVVLRLTHVSRAERKVCRNLGVSVSDYRRERWRRHFKVEKPAGHLAQAIEANDLEAAYEKFVDELDRQADVYQFPSEVQKEQNRQRAGKTWLRRERREGMQIARR
jgi:hypothetical protein